MTNCMIFCELISFALVSVFGGFAQLGRVY